MCGVPPFFPYPFLLSRSYTLLPLYTISCTNYFDWRVLIVVFSPYAVNTLPLIFYYFVRLTKCYGILISSGSLGYSDAALSMRNKIIISYKVTRT
jgi:hypothetical protein